MRFICTICAELMWANERICATPCGHVFHQACLGAWLKNSENCPQCRGPLRTEDACRLFPSSGSRGGRHNNKQSAKKEKVSIHSINLDLYKENLSRYLFHIDELQALLPEERFSTEEYTTIQHQIMTLGGYIAWCQDELTQRKSTVNSLTHATKENVTMLEKLKKELSSTEYELYKMKFENNRIKRDLDNVVTEALALRRENRILKDRIQGAKRADARLVNAKQNIIKNFREHVNKFKEELKLLKNENKDLTGRLQEATENENFAVTRAAPAEPRHRVQTLEGHRNNQTATKV